jgi:transposase-like protein
MVNQLSIDKSLAIKHLREQGMSQRAIARALGVSRGAVRRHWQPENSNSTKAPTGKAPTGSCGSNSTKAPTGSEEPLGVEARVASSGNARGNRSLCEPLRQVILSKLDC